MASVPAWEMGRAEIEGRPLVVVLAPAGLQVVLPSLKIIIRKIGQNSNKFYFRILEMSEIFSKSRFQVSRKEHFANELCVKVTNFLKQN